MNFKYAIKIGKEYLKGSTGEIRSLLLMYYSKYNTEGDSKGRWKIRTTPHVLEAKTWSKAHKGYADRFVNQLRVGKVVEIKY